LDGSNGDGVNNVFGLAAAGEVIAGEVEAMKDGADGGSDGGTFGEFGCEIASV
jgi:hypothetical protein